MFSFEMLCKQLVSRVSSGDQTLENNKTLALRARVSYRFLVFGSPDETLKLVVFTYNIKLRENHYPAPEYMLIYTILSLKFKLSNEKTAFVPRDNVIFLRYFTQIHDFAMRREIL